MQTKRLTFENPSGVKLSALLDMPVNPVPNAYALFAHCFTCTKNFKAAHNVSNALNQAGIAVLRFDFTGLGDSEGDFSETGLSSNVEDVVAAADFLKAEYEAPQILIGHSLGGAAVLQAAGRIDSTRAVTTIAAPGDPRHVEKHLSTSREQLEKDGEAEVQLGGKSFKIKKQFLDDLDSNRMKEAIRKLHRKSLLILHSPIDNVVGIDNAATIFMAAKHPKSFVSLDQADHLLSDERDSLYAGAVIAAWARKYIGIPMEKIRPAESEDHRVVARTGKSGYRTEISASGHDLIADEPKSLGGSDMGPNPYDYLAAGLGACTTMTLRMYADRKEWPLDEIVARLKHQKVHADACEDCETKSGKLDEIDREIEVIGDLSEEQRKRLLEIADKCPVHRTLHSEIKIRTRIKAENPKT
ncbi:MAG: alpha/beta fold hydrolase [Thermodesulfobacteriota bacterium]